MLSKFYRNITDYYTKNRYRNKKQKRRYPWKNLNNSRVCWFSDDRFGGFLKFFKDKKFIREDYVCKKNVAYLKIPEIFSFTNNPTETIHTLQRLVGMYSDSRVHKIRIDHCDCKELEISASLLMDAILWEIDYRRNRIGKPIRFSGIFKHEENNVNNENILELLACSGVLKHLNVLKDVKVPKHIETLDFYDEYIKLHKNVSDEYAGQEVAKYFNRCYEKCDFRISDEGINKISDLVSEIVLNCDNHSGATPNRWFCQGHYFVKKSDGNNKRIGECQLSIISIGNSFYDSINGEGTEFIKNKIENQYSKFKSKWERFFCSARARKRKEIFYSLYCLQENVSRYKEDTKTTVILDDENKDRGKGTVTLFENFQKLGKTNDGKKPIMSITSGSSSIIVDGTYKMDFNDNKVRVIAFNKENDLNLEPDEKFVHTIESFFPGVVINLKFYIDEKYLENIVKNKE